MQNKNDINYISYDSTNPRRIFNVSVLNPPTQHWSRLMDIIAFFCLPLLFMLSWCCHTPASVNWGTASTLQCLSIQHRCTKAWELCSVVTKFVSSAPKIHHSIPSEKGGSKHTVRELSLKNHLTCEITT